MSDTTTKLSRVASLRQALKEATKPVSLSPSSSSQSTTVHTFLLKNVSIPIAVLPKNITVTETKGDNSQSLVSEEGLVLCHVWIRNGKIHKVTTTTSSSSSFTEDDHDVAVVDDNDNAMVVDCQRSLLIPCFVDCHTHLDKTWTVSRTRNKSGTMDEAWLHKEPSDWKHWTLDDLTRRMRFAVQCAIYYGTKALRTHLDGYNCGEDHALEEQLQNNVYAAYTAIKEAYQDQITLQVVANLYLPLYYSHPDLARAHCSRANQVPGAVLGAYIGNTTQTPEDDTCQHLDAMLDLAAEFDMDIDLHIDESNDPHCCALRPLCRSLLKARQKGYQGNVVLGHCCALSLQDDDTKTFICTQLAQLGNVYVVANPFTNLSLQDRRGTKPPLGVEIPAEKPRTPQWRGVTLLQELRQAGVTVASASDNVRDFWLSAGSDYDMLSVWSTTQALCHLDTAPNEGSWADIVTTCPAMAMNLMKDSESPLDVGQSADLVLFPGARYASELFSRPQIDRIVIRKGIILETQLPDYAELDDLMEVASAEKGNPNNKKPKGEAENLLDLLGLNEGETLTSQHLPFTRIPHLYQLESWDCGPTCLMMLLRWLESNDTFSTIDESFPSSILTPRDMEERRRILDAVNTKSIWTSDLMWQLQKWKQHDEKRCQFVLISNNISTADQDYENFEYYQQSFSDDQDRVCWTFTELHRQAVPMMESSHFPLSTVLHVTSRYKDVVAMLLVDNSILRNRREQLDGHPNPSSPTAYAGHYVILCGTSDDPQHVEKANRVRPDNTIATQRLTDTRFGVCCVLANPDPASPSPLEFVMPDHLEAAWRSKGTDDDIIFLRKFV